ncbi:hypothetical protein ACHAWU_008245 [Discostella pseudostelligera]|uniref:Uncharacterized protein n=1 Tax=Discostella pseudostelligera TaxID=259834 RepID=A0ABD3M6T4_9STRA
MVADFRLLRDPRFIKAAVISTAVIAVSVGVGLTVAGTRKAPVSSAQVNGGSGIEAVSKNGAANNQGISSYLANSGGDHLDTIDEIVDTSDGTTNGETINGYSLYGVYRDSDASDSEGDATPVKTVKCGGAVVSSEESSSKSDKESGRRRTRRLGWSGPGWGQPIVSSGSGLGTAASTSAKSEKTEIASSSAKSEKTEIVSSSAKSEKTEIASSSAKSEKTEIASSGAKSAKAMTTSSTSSSKSEKTVEVSEGASSWGAGAGDIAPSEDESSSWGASATLDVDCETEAVVVVASKGVSSKSSKTKSSKLGNSSAKITSTTSVSSASAWERSPTTVSNVWGSSPVTIESTTSPAPSTSSEPSSVPSTSSQPSITQLVVESTTAAPTPCTGRVWYYNEEKEKCINDGENGTECGVYESMLKCCEMEVGVNIVCPYEDVCFTESPTEAPTPKPTTLAPAQPEVITVEPTTSPITSEPTSAAPTSDAPNTPEIATESPTTSAPITSEPTSAAPTVPEIVTESPTSAAPITSEPTSAAPTSGTPTIIEFITEAPSTAAPVTSEPTSAAPISGTPTVPEIFTVEPTTAVPVTSEPTSAAPTSGTPTAPEIITAQPSLAPTPCEGRKWYALSTQKVFQCTNGYDIPVDAVDFTFFSTMSECCDEMFGVGADCDFKDVCVEAAETVSPTPEPSFGSTPTVSKETSGPPTLSRQP